MNKLIYICCLICCFTVCSCNWYSDPLELVYPGTDLSGGDKNKGESGETVEDKLINSFESVLNTTWYGWKLSGVTTGQQECTVYFIFNTDERTVQTISTVAGVKNSAEYAVAVNGEKQVVINLAGTDLELLGDESLVILEAVEGTISCKGATTATAYTMTNASEDEMDEIDPSDILSKMKKHGMLSGVIRDEAGDFFAHYYANGATHTLQVTYLEDGICKYAESNFESTATAINLTTKIQIKSVEILSITYGSSKYSLTGSGTTRYQLVSNANAGTYVKDGRHEFKLFKNGNRGVEAESTLMEEMNSWDIFTQLELNCGSFAAGQGLIASLVICGDFSSLGINTPYEFLIPKEGYLRETEPDRFYFEFLRLYYNSAAAYEKAKEKMPSVFDTWYHAEGLHLILDEKNGETYLYLLSPATGKWFKFVQTV